MSDQPTIFITGGTSGVGTATALALAKAGAEVVFTARSNELGEITQQEIVQKSGNQSISFLVADLSSLAHVRSLAEKFISQHSRLDVLINNAGVMEHERKLSSDGFEMDFAVNYLAPFLLTNLLLPLLRSSAPARIVNVSSSLHKEGEIDFNDLQSENDFEVYKTYAQSKLALVLFTKKLARTLIGTGVTANALNPGIVATRMSVRNIAHMNPIVRLAYRASFLTPSRGAETSVYLALSPEVTKVSGAYFEKKKVEKSSPLSYDESLADKLWDVSTKLVDLQ